MADRKPQKAAKKLGKTIKGGAKSVVKFGDFLLGKPKKKKK
jgi:hypothetical protein